MDEWASNKVFVKQEISLLAARYEVKVITNDVAEDTPEGVMFYTYERTKNHLKYCAAVINFLFNREAWEEVFSMLSERKNVKNRFGEIFRFYVNAQLFYKYLKERDFIENSSDVVYYSFWYFWKCYAITKNRKKIPDVKIIARVHGYELYKDSLASNWQPFKMAMDKALDKLIFVSDYGMDYYLNSFHHSLSDKYKLYYLGTTNSYGMQVYKKGKTFRVVSCSSLIPLKRVELIIEALSLIDDISIEWIHFGGGELEYEIITQADQLLGNMSNINYQFKGNYPNEKILEFYSNTQTDLFITTTESEGGNPVSIMEAMSFGIPVLATGICNLPNMIVGNGALLPPNPTSQDVAEKIRYIYQMPEEQIKCIRRKSRELWEENYMADKNYEKFVKEIFV